MAPAVAAIRPSVSVCSMLQQRGILGVWLVGYYRTLIGNPMEVEPTGSG